MSALDGSFLRLESRRAHMHMGFSAVFASPSRDRQRPAVELLRERVAGRLHGVPWCRWRLDDAPLGLSEPRWVEDSEFDLAAHIVQLTQPGDRVSYECFEALRSAVLSTPLDRSRPLWQIFLVPLLQDGRVGMVGKIHHALADGIAALQIVRLVVDDEPDARTESPVGWQPHGRVGAVGWVLGTLEHAVEDGLAAARTGAGALARPKATTQRALRGAKGMVGAVEDVLARAPRSALNGPTGPRRTLVGYHARRDELRAARAGGGTLNDVGLAVVAGALRALSLREGESPAHPLKAMIPVNMRALGDAAAGNQFSMLNIGLPVHLAIAQERLDWVRGQTNLLKYTDRPASTYALYRAGGLLPSPLRGPVVRALSAPRVFNLTVSQSPAPRGPLYLLGCELQEVYSVVPIAQDHALAIGMVRYNQELFFGCHAEPHALPAVYDLPAMLEAEVLALGDPRTSGATPATPAASANVKPAVTVPATT
ncbi:MAG: wax ester/triacylglycerol synthase family O-acyltransferase [Actinomycetota bacterium]|nr:wax ester/triacylglycerol synthase family O-acyltransferase [Actinomycetota bacterium]